MAHQKERFESFLVEELANFFSKEAAGILPEGAFVSVSRAEVNESGEEARVYILIFPALAEEAAFRDVRRLEGEARKYLAKRLKRRQIPKIKIKMDDGAGKKIRLEKLLDSVEGLEK